MGLPWVVDAITERRETIPDALWRREKKMDRSRVVGAIVVAGVAAGSLMAAPAAQAKSTWGSSQQVSSKMGWSINVSDDGQVASWVRANRSDGLGPVRTAYYRSAKKGWTSSAEVTGTVGTRDSQMSTDGNYVLANVPGTGYVMAQRANKNTWGAAATIAAGQYLGLAQMSADGNSIVYGEFTTPGATPAVPGSLKYITRAPGGAWSAPVVIGALNDDAYYAVRAEYVSMSRDGGTVTWLDDTWALRASSKQPDGTWSAPVLLKQFVENPYIQDMSLSSDGTRLAWMYSYDQDGVITATRSGTTWTAPTYVTADGVEAMALSPNGNVVAYASQDDDLIVKNWNGTAWGKAKVMGSVKAYGTDIALTNKTLAWTYNIDKQLRASIYKSGKWQSSVKLANNAVAPAVNTNGKTVLWASIGAKKVYSKKR